MNEIRAFKFFGLVLRALQSLRKKGPVVEWNQREADPVPEMPAEKEDASEPAKIYDFKAARKRVEELTHLYRRCARIQPKDGTWDWWLAKAVAELEAELAEAKTKMTALAGRHSVVKIQNVYVPSIPQWVGDGKEVQTHI